MPTAQQEDGHLIARDEILWAKRLHTTTRRQPGVRVELVEGSGHSVQGDRPVALARLIESFLDA